MTRIAPLDPDSMSVEQRSIYDVISSGPRKGVRGPLAIWLRRPGLASPAQALGQYCRYDSSLPPRLSELAIITLGRLWDAEYEWAAHKPIALAAGVDPTVIDAIDNSTVPSFEDEDERLVYEFVNVLSREHVVPRKLYDQIVSILGLDAVIDLVGVVGYYTFISMTIKTFDISVS